MTPAIAIVGMACCFPGARSPAELWEDVLAQRREFRRVPAERLRLEDYWSSDPHAVDSTYATHAAVIEGYEFDRIRFRVAGSTYRAADLSHWLALDVADQALVDAGFPDGNGLPRATTGAVFGNSLTGEFSRANSLRIRWPYIRRIVEPLLMEAGWAPEQRRPFLAQLEEQYKAPFPPPGDETLAGSLSNTIAGRICNHFDLHGGGYTVDGACAASLLAVATACSALVAGDLDVALAGGVDLSLDPLELVGFARVGALATDTMHVYDRRSAGFWPGEGCGVVVLMRHTDAVAQSRRVYALIRGWGISSDGTGGLTRPELDGQLLALERAYRRAGFGIDSVAYFEGHGTGTSVGDAVELRALSQARRTAGGAKSPAAIGSIKANIGHTKAAAGVAGLLKATLAVRNQILPPTTGCDDPHPELRAEHKPPALRVLDRAECWPTDQALRAGVSAMGFGGINAHVVLEATAASRASCLDPQTQRLVYSAQDTELFLFDGGSVAELVERVDTTAGLAAGLAWSELGDVAAMLQGRLTDRRYRAAVVASRPDELADRLRTLRNWLTADAVARVDAGAGIFLGSSARPPRIGFLFPGQGSPASLHGGALRRRFAEVDALYADAELPLDGDVRSTAVAQPAIATASLAGLSVLARLGLQAVVGVGHSLGEIVALHWAGAFDSAALRRIVHRRGHAMAELACGGGMASIAADATQVEILLGAGGVVLAGLNAPTQTVVAGPLHELERAIERARARGWDARRLPVSHAFHSPLVAPAIPVVELALGNESLQPLQRTVFSTVTGARLEPAADTRGLLCLQVTAPVRFQQAASAACQEADLLIEVGPGQVLTGLVGSFSSVPTLATDAGGPSLRGILSAVGAAFALGAELDHAALFADRFTRPFELNQPSFFVNPCELAPTGKPPIVEPLAREPEPERQIVGATVDPAPPLELFRRLVAERSELPPVAVLDASRLLSDLHLNSITVSQLVAEAARRLGAKPPSLLTAYADATVADVAHVVEELPRDSDWRAEDDAEGVPAGVDAWVRAFTVELVERPGPSLSQAQKTEAAGWQVLGPYASPLADAIRERLARIEAGTGVVVCLSPELGENDVGRLLEGARLVRSVAADAKFVVVQHGGGGAAFTRTMHLEAPSISTCVLDLPVDDPRAPDWVAAEVVANPGGHTEAYYDSAGCRRVPLLRILPLGGQHPDGSSGTCSILGPDDVVLATGGGKGIVAECARALAIQTGARLGLFGRSEPESDAELAANLQRLTRAGVRFAYRMVDVLDVDAVRTAIGTIESELGPVTAVLHGAGLNVPQQLATLDVEAVTRTLAPKVSGARNVLAALDLDRLRLFVAFGSIIARSGLWGEAHYGLANEWLGGLVERFQTEHPACHCLVVEWSVWSDVGMGARLGSLEPLVRRGVTPIPPHVGVATLMRLLSQRSPTSVVVTGRYAALPTLAIESRELPFLRFLERPRVHYPGVELVVEADVSVETDPYLADHVLQGERLFPAVLGLEAMAQTAVALLETSEPPAFEAVHFDRPIVVPESGSVTIRIAALMREPGRVELVLRCAHTGFLVDHFRAICTLASGRAVGPQPPTAVPELNGQTQPGTQDWLPYPGPETDSGVIDPHHGALAEQWDHAAERARHELSFVPLDPACDLYGRLLFHTGRFQRLAGYYSLHATECLAEIAASDSGTWFGRYMPPDLVLGDPALRDTAIHAIQACIPHAVVVPTGVDRFWCKAWRAGEAAHVWAREREHEGQTYVYDVDVAGADGKVAERWEGLRLRQVGAGPDVCSWSLPLLATHVERRVRELVPGARITVALEVASSNDRQLRSQLAVRRAVGPLAVVCRRPDGKPELIDQPDVDVSTAHAGKLTLCVVANRCTGCDLEEVVARPASAWRDLLGAERFHLADLIAREQDKNLDCAATRVWSATEALHKAGAPLDAPLVLRATHEDGWLMLGAGGYDVPTYVPALQGGPHRWRFGLAVALMSTAASSLVAAGSRVHVRDAAS